MTATARPREHPRAPRSSGTLPLAVAFAGLGGTASIVPAVLPAVMASRPAAAGSGYLLAVPTTFLGLLVGVVLSIRLIRRSSARTTVAIGALTQGAALGALVVLPPAPGFVVAAGGAGLGFGLVEAAGSALAREVAGAAVTRLLSGLTTAAALTAAASPVAVAFLPLAAAPSIALALVAVLHLGAAALLAVERRPGGERPMGSREERRGLEPSAAGVGAPPTGTRSGLVRVAVALFLYVGVEATLSGYSAVIATTLLTSDVRRAALGTSAFWLLMGAGRLVASLTLRSRHASSRRQLGVVTGCGAALLLIAAAAVGSPVRQTVALAGAVCFLGPCYSLILGSALSGYPAVQAARITGPLVACGAVGGALLPALTLATGTGPSAPTTLVLAAALVLLDGLLVVARRPDPADTRRSRTARPGPRSRTGRPGDPS